MNNQWSESPTICYCTDREKGLYLFLYSSQLTLSLMNVTALVDSDGTHTTEQNNITSASAIYRSTTTSQRWLVIWQTYLLWVLRRWSCSRGAVEHKDLVMVSRSMSQTCGIFPFLVGGIRNNIAALWIRIVKHTPMKDKRIVCLNQRTGAMYDNEVFVQRV